jgi:hypothetical protein
LARRGAISASLVSTGEDFAALYSRPAEAGIGSNLYFRPALNMEETRVNETPNEVLDGGKNGPILLRDGLRRRIYAVWNASDPRHYLANMVRFAAYDSQTEKWDKTLTVNDDGENLTRPGEIEQLDALEDEDGDIARFEIGLRPGIDETLRREREAFPAEQSAEGIDLTVVYLEDFGLRFDATHRHAFAVALDFVAFRRGFKLRLVALAGKQVFEIAANDAEFLLTLNFPALDERDRIKPCERDDSL